MVKTKLFTGYYARKNNQISNFIEPDMEINEFLEKNPSVEVVDIKLSSYADPDGGGWHSALMIYKEGGR